jgi:hypothetical protein
VFTNQVDKTANHLPTADFGHITKPWQAQRARLPPSLSGKATGSNACPHTVRSPEFPACIQAWFSRRHFPQLARERVDGSLADPPLTKPRQRLCATRKHVRRSRIWSVGTSSIRPHRGFCRLSLCDELLSRLKTSGNSSRSCCESRTIYFLFVESLLEFVKHRTGRREGVVEKRPGWHDDLCHCSPDDVASGSGRSRAGWPAPLWVERR